MPRTHKQDPEFLEAALIGLQHTLAALELRIAELRSQLGGQPVSAKAAPAAPESGAKKRTMSASARRRIGLAQKKRWAAFNAAKSKPAAPKPPKRVMSAEGRARIIAATKKRWAAFHKAQQPAKPAAKKAAKTVARKAPAATKAPEAAAPTAAAASTPTT
jgi:colicin import membrane protein